MTPNFKVDTITEAGLNRYFITFIIVDSKNMYLHSKNSCNRRDVSPPAV